MAHGGEQMTFSVRFRGIEGGRARLAVAPDDQSSAIVARAQGESAGLVAQVLQLSDDITARLARDDATPEESRTVTLARGKEIRVHARYGDGRARLEVVTNGGAPRQVTRRLPVDAPTFDSVGTIFVLRGLEAAPGTRAHFYTLGGQRLWHVQLTVAEPETIDTALGPVRARRIDGTATRLTPALAVDGKHAPRRFAIWITDDARALPVRITAATELGDVVATLTSYTPGS